MKAVILFALFVLGAANAGSVKVVDAPAMVAAPVESIKVVEQAIDDQAIVSPFAVKFVDEAINDPANSFDAYLAKQAAEPQAAEKVSVVDMPAAVQENNVFEKVNVVDLPEAISINALEDFAVRVVEQAMNAPENSFDALAKQAAEPIRASELETIRINPDVLNQVRVVDTPIVPGRGPAKVYPNPMLRNNQ